MFDFMALTQEQQAIELISRAKHILLITREHPSVDAMASLVAMTQLLTALKKSFDAVAQGVDKKTLPSFLEPIGSLLSSVGPLRAFHVRVNVNEVPLSELTYTVKDGVLDMTLVPKTGTWSPQDVSFRHGEERYDLVMAFGVPDLASLGALTQTHSDFLYRTPIINVDHASTNEHWGQVNMVDLNAASVTETLTHWIFEWNKTLVHEPMATALLAGMIAETHGFRTARVTPRTLTTASELMAMGAKRQEITHGLWRTRTVPALKLWGRALSRLEQDRERGLVWTTVTESDEIECGATRGDLDGVVSELISSAPEAKVVVMFLPRAGSLEATIHAQPPLSAIDLARVFGGSGTRERAVFHFQDTTTSAEQIKTIINRLRTAIQS